MTQGIAVYKYANGRFFAVIDDEVWAIEADGQKELRGTQSTLGPFYVGGARVDSISDLPAAVQGSIASRCEFLDGSSFKRSGR